MNKEIKYKYNFGDTVQVKKRFRGIASDGLKALAGKVVTIIDRRYYGEPCYKFEGLADSGWFTESVIKCKVNPYVVFVGDSRDDLEPLEAVSSKAAAVSSAKTAQSEYSCVEAIYMPEDDENTHEIVYSHYEEAHD